jgi:glutaminyl-peptide cyclotransferase
MSGMSRKTAVLSASSAVLLATAALIGARSVPQNAPPTPRYGFRVVHEFRHDPEAFTQGLEFRAGVLYEGTGLEGRSTLRKEDLSTGKVLEQIPLDPQYFGEGITVLNGKVLQLTWKSEHGFVYDQSSFRLLRGFDYRGEGWGLANDGTRVYMSDGTAQIRRIDPVSLRELQRITVHDGTQPIDQLNELEWVRGELYANIWQTDRIARISPDDGRVLGWIDLTGLLPARERSGNEDVLNGIAYDAEGDRLFVTGKLWPKLFEIKLTSATPANGS